LLPTEPGDVANSALNRWTVDEVRQAMRQGHVFYTKGESSGKVALVEEYYCARCGKYHIRSRADAVLDNNLNNLVLCLASELKDRG
jgi:hypothetical protein